MLSGWRWLHLERSQGACAMTDPARNAAPPARNDLGHIDRLIREGQLADAHAALVSAEPGDIDPAARELRLSRVAAMRKETEASDRHARQAAELLGPTTRESLVGYVNAVLNMTDRDAAELCMTALAGRFPRHPEPVFGLARLAARAGAHDRALSLAADGLVRDPGHWQLHRFRLLELIRTGRNAEIDACAATIEEVFGESDALRETREILTNRSATATAPAPERAAAPVETVAAILERARALMDAGEATDALGLLRREGAARGNDVNILLQEGEMREQIGDFEAAEVTYAKAAALYPQNPRPRILRSRLALRLQRNDDALVYADAAVAAAPTSPHAHLVRCDALSALDRREALAAAVAHLLTLSPDGGQLVRVARHCERLNLAETTNEVLRQGLMADIPAEPIVGHVMARAGSRVHPDILDRWTASLARVLPSTPYNRLIRRNLLENGHHEEVLGLVRRMPTRERDFREAGDLFESLIGLRRYRVAQRYASFAARYWPLQMVQRRFMLHIRFGELDEAAEMVRIRLSIERGTSFDVAPDASAASYAWGAALATGGTVTVTGPDRSPLQGHRAAAHAPNLLLQMQGRDIAPNGGLRRLRQLHQTLHGRYRAFLNGRQNHVVALTFVHVSSLDHRPVVTRDFQQSSDVSIRNDHYQACCTAI